MLTGYLVACIGPNIDSVHFYATWFGTPKKIDFGRVPQAYNVIEWNNEPVRCGTQSTYEIENWDLDFHQLADNPPKQNVPDVELFDFIGGRRLNWYQDDDDRALALRNLVHHARNLEVAGKFKEAISEFRNASISLTFQSFSRDREELLTAGVSPSTKGYKEYLRASYLLAFGYVAQGAKAIEELKNLDSDPKLRPHIAYLLADEEANLHPEQAAAVFEKVVKDYPKSPRAEAAMMMSARAHVGEGDLEKEWEEANKLFRQVLETYPKTRFRDNIEGWLGGYELQRRNVAGAIVHYVRQSHSSNLREARKGEGELAQIAKSQGRPTNAICHLLLNRHRVGSPILQIQAGKQIRNLVENLNAKDAKRLQNQVSQDPILLQSYLEFRLSDTAMSPKEESRLLEFTSNAANRLGKLDSSFYAYLAELNYRVGRYHDAIRYARKTRQATTGDAARALFVEGGALDRIGQHQEAIRTYESLVSKSHAPAYLLTTAKEQLAFLHEKHGDKVRAFELYRDIGHLDDIGFMVDNELSYGQIARMISHTANHQERAILKYSLAMRYFRDEKYEAAKHTLLTLPTDLRHYHGVSGPTYVQILSYWSYSDSKVLPPVDPLKDVETLSRLRSQAERAKNQESRAKALYAMAQYTHSRRNLLYYSPGLWMGNRSNAYGLYWNPSINKGHFQNLMVNGAFNQECDAQTLKFCQELIRRCPRSSYVPKALYTAGVCANKLSDFNNMWRNFGGYLNKRAIKYMNRLAREYPHDPLAKSAAKYAAVFAGQDTPDY